ncbi:DUF4386 domain-containing protein [Schumannella luteola]
MTRDRRLALSAGVLYLVTFVTSIPALALKTAYLTGGAPAAAASAGAVLELALAASCVGTALALYPITRRVSESLALGFVASRTIEASTIITGVLALLSVVALRDAGESDTVAVALHDSAFLLGPAVMAATNALLLGSVLYRARLVPRIIPLVGLIGAPILLASAVAMLFGLWTQTSPIGALSALPIAVWEFTLGVWLVVKGVRPEPADRNAERA